MGCRWTTFALTENVDTTSSRVSSSRLASIDNVFTFGNIFKGLLCAKSPNKTPFFLPRSWSLIFLLLKWLTCPESSKTPLRPVDLVRETFRRLVSNAFLSPNLRQSPCKWLRSIWCMNSFKDSWFYTSTNIRSHQLGPPNSSTQHATTQGIYGLITKISWQAFMKAQHTLFRASMQFFWVCQSPVLIV